MLGVHFLRKYKKNKKNNMAEDNIEEIRQKKCERINELCEEKNVDTQDDYFEDIFNEGGTLNEIFRVMSSRGFETHP